MISCSASLPRKSKHGHTWPPPRARVVPRRTFLHLSYSCASPFGPAILVTQDPNRTPTALVALGSRPAVQRIVPGPGDGVFDAGEVIVQHFLGSTRVTIAASL